MSVKTALFVAGAVAAGILLLRLHAESESTASSVFAQATPGGSAAGFARARDDELRRDGRQIRPALLRGAG